jgi:hypothetical protein
MVRRGRYKLKSSGGLEVAFWEAQTQLRTACPAELRGQAGLIGLSWPVQSEIAIRVCSMGPHEPGMQEEFCSFLEPGNGVLDI